MSVKDQWPLVSADSHVIEPPNLWLDHMEPAFREHAPRLVKGPTEDAWYLGNKMIFQVGMISEAGMRFEDPEAFKHEDRWESVRTSTYDPTEYVRAMEQDGVSSSILYPTLGLVLFRVEDVALANAIFRAYNRWLADFCASAPRQLNGVAVILTADVEAAILELQWAKQAGMVGAMIPTQPGPEMPYDDPRLEPFWAVAEDLAMPLNMHVGSDRSFGPGMGTPEGRVTPAMRCLFEMSVKRSIATMIFGGVFERHPGLKVISVEHELGWVPHFLNQMDFAYAERRLWFSTRLANGRTPRDVWQSNIFITFMEDGLGIRLRDEIGVDNIMWGSDFPHSESTWPESRRILGRVLADVSDADRRKMMNDTASRVYQLQ